MYPIPPVGSNPLWAHPAPFFGRFTKPRADFGHLYVPSMIRSRRKLKFKEVYGANYAEARPEAAALKQKIYRIFAAKTKRTARKRYEEVMALQKRYVEETPEAVVIFEFLERHWPTLVNGIESKLIPKTNNTVELVIRRFDRHYQNFCGFESIESAQLFLGVFEKLYRFTPFSQDAQPGIRGKCPLELAGYDISQVPMTSLCAGLSVAWPLKAPQNYGPNS